MDFLSNLFVCTLEDFDKSHHHHHHQSAANRRGLQAITIRGAALRVWVCVDVGVGEGVGGCGCG